MADFGKDDAAGKGADCFAINAIQQLPALRGPSFYRVNEDVRVHKNRGPVENVNQVHWSKKSASIVSRNCSFESLKAGLARKRLRPERRGGVRLFLFELTAVAIWVPLRRARPPLSPG